MDVVEVLVWRRLQEVLVETSVCELVVTSSFQRTDVCQESCSLHSKLEQRICNLKVLSSSSSDLASIAHTSQAE